MRDGDWKLIFTPFDPPQLYDLVVDPAERNDLAAKHPEVVARMMDSHHKWCGTFERSPMWLGSPGGNKANRNLHRRQYQLTQPTKSDPVTR